MLAGGGVLCPVILGIEYVHDTEDLNAVQRGADEALEACRNIICFRPENWVPTEHYEEAMTRNEQLKEGAQAATTSAEVLHVMNRARYCVVVYLICCCIYVRPTPLLSRLRKSANR